MDINEANSLQTDFNSILKTIGEVELEDREKMGKAVKALLDKFATQLNSFFH